MNVVLYGRVSTKKQDCEGQFAELRPYCLMKGWTIIEEIADVISGSKGDREGLNRLIEGVKAKKYDAVCAVKIDRIARSTVHFGRICELLIKHDVALIVPAQAIDTSKMNPCGKFQLNILVAVAELERDFIRERTKAGIVVARANGSIFGKYSTRMPSEPDREPIVQEWREAGRPRGYRGLGAMLGGVSAATALRVDRKVPEVAPATP